MAVMMATRAEAVMVVIVVVMMAETMAEEADPDHPRGKTATPRHGTSGSNSTRHPGL